MDKTSMQVYCENRLKNIMIKDKANNPQKISNVLSSEILYVLKNYLEINDYDLDIDVSIADSGCYHIKIEADCRNIKNVSYIS